MDTLKFIDSVVSTDLEYFKVDFCGQDEQAEVEEPREVAAFIERDDCWMFSNLNLSPCITEQQEEESAARSPAQLNTTTAESHESSEDCLSPRPTRQATVVKIAPAMKRSKAIAKPRRNRHFTSRDAPERANRKSDCIFKKLTRQMKKFYVRAFENFLFLQCGSKIKYNIDDKNEYECYVSQFIASLDLEVPFDSLHFRFFSLMLYTTKHKEDTWYKPSEDPYPEFFSHFLEIFNSNSNAKLKAFFSSPIICALFKFFYDNFQTDPKETFVSHFARELRIDEERLIAAMAQHTEFCF